MAATIFTGTSAWTVSGRVFYLLLEAAKTAHIDPESRFLELIDQFDAVHLISLDELDDLTRADVVDALLKGTHAVLERLQSDSGEVIPGVSAESLQAVFKELDQMLNNDVGDNP